MSGGAWFNDSGLIFPSGGVTFCDDCPCGSAPLLDCAYQLAAPGGFTQFQVVTNSLTSFYDASSITQIRTSASPHGSYATVERSFNPIVTYDGSVWSVLFERYPSKESLGLNFYQWIRFSSTPGASLPTNLYFVDGNVQIATTFSVWRAPTSSDYLTLDIDTCFGLCSTSTTPPPSFDCPSLSTILSVTVESSLPGIDGSSFTINYDRSVPQWNGYWIKTGRQYDFSCVMTCNAGTTGGYQNFTLDFGYTYDAGGNLGIRPLPSYADTQVENRFPSGPVSGTETKTGLTTSSMSCSGAFALVTNLATMSGGVNTVRLHVAGTY